MISRKFLVRILVGLLLITSMTLLAACGSNDRLTAEEGGEKLEIETVKQGHLGFPFKRQDRPEFRVFRDEADWNEFWSESTTRATGSHNILAKDNVDPIVPGQPHVDPDYISDQLSPIAWSANYTWRDMVVGVFLYQGSGYSVTINEVRKLKNKILVEVVGETFDDDRPGQWYAPYHIVKVKKYDLPVEFRFIDKR